MPFRDTLKSLFTRQDNHAVVSTKAIDWLNTDIRRHANWSDYGSRERIATAAKHSVTVFACVRLLADAVAEAPLKVYRLGATRTEDPTHRARQIISNPNPFMSEADLITNTVFSMAYHGFAAIEKVRSASGLPTQLWPLVPDWLTKEKRSYVEDNRIEETRVWVYRVPGKAQRDISLTDVIIIPYLIDHMQASYGISPLHVACREVGIDVGLTDLLKTFLDSGGIPPYALVFPNEISDPAEIRQFQKDWSDKYGGNKAFGKIPVLHGGFTIQKVGDGLNEMAWPDLRGLTEMKIAQAFGVPAGLIQARDSLSSGSLTTTEMDGDMAYLQRHGAEPLRNRIDGGLTTFLLSEFGSISSLELDFDTSQILALQEAKNDLHERVRADYDSGAITLNQFLAETSRPTLGMAGDVYKIPFSVSFLNLTQMTSAPNKTDVIDVPALPLSPAKQKLSEIGTRKLSQLVARMGAQGDQISEAYAPYKQIMVNLYQEVEKVTRSLLPESDLDSQDVIKVLMTSAQERHQAIFEGIATDVARVPDPTDLLSSDYRDLLTKTIEQEIDFAFHHILRRALPATRDHGIRDDC